MNLHLWRSRYVGGLSSFSGGPLQGLVIDSDSYTRSKDFSGHLGGTLSLMDGDWVSDIYGNFTGNQNLGYSGSDYGSKRSRQEFGVTSSYRFMAEKTAHSAYTLVNASANYRVTDWIEVYGRVENLTGETYRDVLGYATPGRAGFATMLVELQYSGGINRQDAPF